jgi:hypothetical protein
MSRAAGNSVATTTARRASFRDVFAMGEFRALWASQILSAGGDRLALVALTLLIYDRTRSPLLAAIAFASGTLPYFVGALFLSGLADRFPRRTVMVIADAVRMVMVAAMLVPRMPLDALIVLLYAVTAFQPLFDSARSAIIRDVVTKETYPLAAGALQSTYRILIVAGAALGGLLVALVGARWALGLDAASFAASGVILQAGLRARPAAKTAPGQNALVELARGIPPGLRGYGAADADAPRVAGGVLRDPGGNRCALRRETRRRTSRRRPAYRVDPGRLGAGHAILHQADRAADTTTLDGTDGRVHLPGARADGPPPKSRRLHGDLPSFEHLHGVPDRRQYRVRGESA